MKTEPVSVTDRAMSPKEAEEAQQLFSSSDKAVSEDEAYWTMPLEDLETLTYSYRDAYTASKKQFDGLGRTVDTMIAEENFSHANEILRARAYQEKGKKSFIGL